MTRNRIFIFLSTGYCIGCITAILLNNFLPVDQELSFAEEEKVVDLPVELDNTTFAEKLDIEEDVTKEENGFSEE